MPEIKIASLDPTSTLLTDGGAAIAAKLTQICEEWRKRNGKAKEYGSEGFPSRGDLSKMVMALNNAFQAIVAPGWIGLR